MARGEKWIGIVLCICLVGCAGVTLEQVENLGVYTVLELAGILTKLLSLDYRENMDGLERLEEMYEVELTDPTEAFFEAAKEEIRALKALKIAMETTGNRKIQQGEKEIERLIEAIDDLILRYDPDRVKDIANFAAIQQR